MTGESGDCKVNPNNQSRERGGRGRRWEYRAGGQSTRIGTGTERGRGREVDEVSPERAAMCALRYGPFRQLS